MISELAPSPCFAGAGPCADGVLVIDKEPGASSHDIVIRLRRALRIRSAGHAGTLDPMATGVLVIALGEATKLVPWLTAHDKSYEATIALGATTDTLDAEGRITERVPLDPGLLGALSQPFESNLVQDALQAERARTEQVPPAFSAIHCSGERAYARARRGETFALAAREVRVQKLSLVACRVDPPSISLCLDVAKGYYVRSLARDIALALGTLGHLSSLRRTRSGSFPVEEAILASASREQLLEHMTPLSRAAARALPSCILTEGGATAAMHGRPVAERDMSSTARGPHAWFNSGGLLIAVGEIDADHGRVLRGFKAA